MRRFFARLLESLHAPFSPSEGLTALEIEPILI